jgi:spore maturation protein SpmA/phosphoribosylformylglycinamidine (FGAM) synthase-like amidotransferase family enzyme
VRAEDLDEVSLILREHGFKACSTRVGALNRTHTVRISRGARPLLDAEPLRPARRLVRRHAPDRRTARQSGIRSSRSTRLRTRCHRTPGSPPTDHLLNRLTAIRAQPAAPAAAGRRSSREQGVNGEVEMAAAFTRAGFKAIDVHMTDLLSGRVSLLDFRGLAACGGFSYGDVLGAGEGWAKSILFNERTRAAFAEFFAREDTFALGVCNGCQMMSNLHSIIPGAGPLAAFRPEQIRTLRGPLSCRCRSRKARACSSPAWRARSSRSAPSHGEGYAEFTDPAAAAAPAAIPASWPRASSTITTASTRAVPAQSERLAAWHDRAHHHYGPRHRSSMPHPERVFRTACDELGAARVGEDSPWMRLFYNARSWVGLDGQISLAGRDDDAQTHRPMLNYLWLGLVALAALVGGATGRLREVTEGAFRMADVAVMKIALPLIGVMALWLGLMRLAERSGLVQQLARGLRPLLRRLFPEVPPDHPAMGSMVMNMAANMLGLANAATPLGLRAMRDLETLNRHPGTATNSMCTFLAINTASIQLLPTTAIAILAAQHSKNPTAIVGTALLASICSTSVGISAAKWLQSWRIFRVAADAPAAPTGNKAGADPEPASPLAAEPGPMNGWGRAAVVCLFAAFAGLLAWMVARGRLPRRNHRAARPDLSRPGSRAHLGGSIGPAARAPRGRHAFAPRGAVSPRVPSGVRRAARGQGLRGIRRRREGGLRCRDPHHPLPRRDPGGRGHVPRRRRH